MLRDAFKNLRRLLLEWIGTGAISNPVPKPSKITKQYKLNYFEPDANSNKVWIGSAFDDGLFEAQFGRVRDGANLAKKQKKFKSRAEAETELERKRNEKLRKGYRDTVVVDNEAANFLPAKASNDLSRIASEEIGGASEDSVTVDLIKYLAEVNIHRITHSANIRYNSANATFSTPLGVLAPDAISAGRTILNEIRQFNLKEAYGDPRRIDLVREYFQLVPKDFGMKVPASVALLAEDGQIGAEADLLDALEAVLGIEETGEKKRIFDCRLMKVPHYTDEGRSTFGKVNGLFEKTRNSKHHPATSGLEMVRLYEVEIASMKSRFEEKANEIGNVRQGLWHGTRASNLLSILKNGLMIPPANAAHCTGRMFGNGIYTSLQSTKALNYATGFWNSGGASGQRIFMFLCEAALGKVYKPKYLNRSFPAGSANSTWVEAGTSGVLNHECIVYDVSQINLLYLAEFGLKQ